ncbi:MAG TPA: agmatinase family protein [Chitinophagaceae bacterium]|nr:agmatinase family protein [Chitinophagaceae bacterium]
MTDLSTFNPNVAANPDLNIFGLPFSEEDARVILLPVPWEVTVSCGAGTARSAEHICKASLQVDLFDADVPNGWRRGFYMRPVEMKILMKSDYLRKEAELFMNYISKGEDVDKNKFMCKSRKEINEGGEMLNAWVYEQTTDLLNAGKLVGLIGGEHGASTGFYRAIAEKYGQYGILQIDAHCDLRKAYNNFRFSHASVMYNALTNLPQIERLVQLGVRDYSEEEWNYVCNSNYRVISYFDQQIKQRLYEGETWRHITDEIVDHLPQKVFISFDIDGLDPKLCPHTGTPVPGGFELEQMIFLFKKIIDSGRTLIGFDLVEVGVGDSNIDSNVAARALWKLCNYLVKSNE